jgi:uncharacterized protein YfaP (DUF2135 family)
MVENAKEFVTEREMFEVIKKGLEDHPEEEKFHIDLREMMGEKSRIQMHLDSEKSKIQMHLDSEQCRVQIEWDKNSKDIELERIRNFTQKRWYGERVD